MKTTFFAATIAISLTLLVGATVWEGVSTVVPSGNLTGNYSIATNSFPKNSVVDILNLENGKMVRVVVVDGLQANGLLAALSRSAADAIDLRGNAACRIRITQPPADIAFAHYKLGPIDIPAAVAVEAESLPDEGVSYGVSDEPQDAVVEALEAPKSSDLSAASAVYTADEPAAIEPAPDNQLPLSLDETEKGAAEMIADADDVYNEERIIIAEAAPYSSTWSETESQRMTASAAEPDAEPLEAWELTAAVMSATADEPAAAEPIALNADAVEETPVYMGTNSVMENPLLEEGNGSGMLSMIPSEERLPQAPQNVVIAYENIAPPIAHESQPVTSPAEYIPSNHFSPFQAPLIDRLEQGKWYVQVAVYARVDHVEDEISRIGPGYPLAIQNIGNDTTPKFRVLLGPYNQGESAVMLQRFKSIGYADAFLRNN